MTCISTLNDEIYNVVLNEYKKAYIIWSEQDIEIKYKESWVDSKVKQYCCCHLVNKWFDREGKSCYEYDDDLCEILNTCKGNYLGPQGSRSFPLSFYEPKKLLKHYIYEKCDEHMERYRKENIDLD